MERSIDIVKGKWDQLTSYSKKDELKNSFWQEIAESYTADDRHYHNMDHLVRLFKLLEEHLPEIQQPAIVAFSIIYHDLVFNTSKSDNEEQSAAKAKEQLQLINLRSDLISHVESFILATRDHKVSDDFQLKNDLSYFLDFDLAILGAPWEEYDAYRQNIRQEFLQYRGPVYKAGRIEALKKLMIKPSLFHTDIFKNTYEQQARENMEHELSLL
ncbi:MAG: hypothetical protein JWQ96_1502 [Segetibacter sp.]|nr:hypothetical protein [Segetibacter sp.]